ncbi:chorismate mutase 2-like [Amaranthus tricolor]|uniref:chorismate mutase 2-like n=1 Tax=Amaranthus tricolor TaxID=29722 RepID=UPI00258B26A4|nr:chorismate mutase 2-like [Amaranthus tricolor]
MAWKSVEKGALLFSFMVAFFVFKGDARSLLSSYNNNGIFSHCHSDGIDNLSLDSIRKTLIGLEDTIIYSLIERAKFPLNSPAYKPSPSPAFHGSFMEFLVKGTEAVQAQGGRYQSPEEVPFFLDHLPPSLAQRPQNCSQDLPAAAASVSVTKNILDFYVNQFLPKLAPSGDHGNYALSVASDLVCLQAISRRIHFGKYVAEAKFRNDTEAYSNAIRAKDKNSLTKLLTDEKVEEMVKQRVEKKARVYGQEVTLNETNNNVLKVDPSLVSNLYGEWVIPLTKDVEIEYLLRRLDS